MAVQQRTPRTRASATIRNLRRAVLVAALAGALAAPASYAWRAPTLQESRLVVKGLPAFYHQSCIRFSVRISTVDRRFAAVFFRFVRARSPCRPFDGQVLMKRPTPTRWTKIGEGSSWPCRVRGVPTRVVRDLFGGCAP
jgi:hypothetical protein